MRKLIAGLALLLTASVSPALAQTALQATTQYQIPIIGTVATSTKIVSNVSGKRIYVTALLLAPVATSVVTFTYGTGTNCGTGTTSITGAMAFASGGSITFGDGSGAVFVVPPSNDLCLTIGTAAAPGSLAYAQF